jgi:DNA-binding winged helix-turn-helix (wHTH) protein
VHLTPIEWQLLEALVRNPGKLISQRQLLQEVRGPTYATETQYLRQYMKHLRRKLEDDPARPRHLITEPGIGLPVPAMTTTTPPSGNGLAGRSSPRTWRSPPASRRR